MKSSFVCKGLVLIFIFACQREDVDIDKVQEDHNHEERSSKSSPTAHLASDDDIDSPLYLVKEDFVSKPFGFSPILKNFSQHLSHQSFVIDTLFENLFNDTIVYYKIEVNDTELFFVDGYLNESPAIFLSAAVIKDKEIELLGGIRVGMTKEEFARIIDDDRVLEEEVVEIGDLEYNAVYKFLFSENRLVEISYLGYTG
ncbi:hypothetical protein RCC89_17920 [Cytophagaceae bacterium ABcell3]|nr:hypothetical protein RCC89_17920 [Cytophagaceae bacterium ABcell3]